MTGTSTTLAAFAKRFKTLAEKNRTNEKNTIANIIEMGKILHDASEQCEHGQYMEWVQAECDCSHQTALNYRSVYDLTQIQNGLDFGELNISITALYRLARMMNSRNNAFTNAVAEAVIETAKRERVDVSKAYEIAHAVETKMAAAVAKATPRPTRIYATPDDDPAAEFVPWPTSIDELRRAMLVLHRVKADDRLWPDIVDDLGTESLREISVMLKTVWTAQHDRNIARANRVLKQAKEADDDQVVAA